MGVDARSGAASSSMPPLGKAKQRNSISLDPMAISIRKALAGLIDSNGDDDDDNDDNDDDDNGNDDDDDDDDDD